MRKKPRHRGIMSHPMTVKDCVYSDRYRNCITLIHNNIIQYCYKLLLIIIIYNNIIHILCNNKI